MQTQKAIDKIKGFIAKLMKVVDVGFLEKMVGRAKIGCVTKTENFIYAFIYVTRQVIKNKSLFTMATWQRTKPLEGEGEGLKEKMYTVKSTK